MEVFEKVFDSGELIRKLLALDVLVMAFGLMIVVQDDGPLLSCRNVRQTVSDSVRVFPILGNLPNLTLFDASEVVNEFLPVDQASRHMA